MSTIPVHLDTDRVLTVRYAPLATGWVVVREGTTFNPVAGASVYVDDTLAGTTGSDGRIHVSVVEGRRVFRVEKSGYETASETDSIPAAFPVIIELYPATPPGTRPVGIWVVDDATRQPIDGVLVEVWNDERTTGYTAPALPDWKGGYLYLGALTVTGYPTTVGWYYNVRLSKPGYMTKTVQMAVLPGTATQLWHLTMEKALPYTSAMYIPL